MGSTRSACPSLCCLAGHFGENTSPVNTSSNSTTLAASATGIKPQRCLQADGRPTAALQALYVSPQPRGPASKPEEFLPSTKRTARTTPQAWGTAPSVRHGTAPPGAPTESQEVRAPPGPHTQLRDEQQNCSVWTRGQSPCPLTPTLASTSAKWIYLVCQGIHGGLIGQESSAQADPLGQPLRKHCQPSQLKLLEKKQNNFIYTEEHPAGPSLPQPHLHTHCLLPSLASPQAGDPAAAPHLSVFYPDHHDGDVVRRPSLYCLVGQSATGSFVSSICL